MTPNTYKLHRSIKPVKPFIQTMVLAQSSDGLNAIFLTYYHVDGQWRIETDSAYSMHSGDGLFGPHSWNDLDTWFDTKEEAIKCFQHFYGKPE